MKIFMIQLRISKIRESDEILSITVTAIFKISVCGVLCVAATCHENIRYLQYLTLKVRYNKYLIS